MGVLAGFAGSLGLSEPAAVLLASLFAGYPLAVIYRQWIIGQSELVQHLFFTVTGGALIFLSYGRDLWHSVFSVFAAYLLCRFLADSIVSVILSFTFQMGHLLYGYYITESEQYDINWTMPQCILTLRLIGLVWDVYDGHKPKNELTKEQEETAITDSPSLLELLAYTYFYGGFLVGPQFPLTRFRKFVSGDFLDPKTGGAPNSVFPCTERLFSGVFWFAVHIIGFSKVHSDFFLTQEFLELSFVVKWLYCILWFNLICCRYLGAWLVADSICILSGLAYNGVDKNGKIKWDGVRNVKVRKCEFASSFSAEIQSFNLSTNIWVARYVYKRMKFLGNKLLSHVITLFFLAIWHGFHLGYFACFLIEFFCVTAERQARELVQRLPKLQEFLTATPSGKILKWAFGKTMVSLGCTYGFIPFGQIKKERWLPIYGSLYFSGSIFWCLIVPITFKILIWTVETKTGKKEAEKEK